MDKLNYSLRRFNRPSIYKNSLYGNELQHPRHRFRLAHSSSRDRNNYIDTGEESDPSYDLHSAKQDLYSLYHPLKKFERSMDIPSVEVEEVAHDMVMIVKPRRLVYTPPPQLRDDPGYDGEVSDEVSE